MNFFRKLFGAKPATPPTPSPATPPAPPAKPAQTPVVPPTPPAAEPPPRVTFSSVTPSAAESAPAPLPPSPPPPAAPVQIETTLLTIDGPVWLPLDSPAIELFAAKTDHAPVIAFIGGSAEVGAPAGTPEHAALVASAGRLSRALPLYLADQVELGTDALTRTLVSWLVKPAPGFILGGKNWDDATAAHHVRRSAADDPADYVVVTHLVCDRDPWRVELRLVRTIDAACLATITASCPADDPGAMLPGLARDLLAELATHLELPSHAPEHALPASSDCLLRLEQLLAVRTAALPGASATLRGEREILEGQLRLCHEHPASLPVRLLFIHSLGAMGKVRPAIRAEFRERAESLHREQPLPEPAQAVLTRLLGEVFAE